MTPQWDWQGLTHPLNHFQDEEKAEEDALVPGQLLSSLSLASLQSPGSPLEGEPPQGLERLWLGPLLCISFPGSPGKLLQERNANNLLV